MIKSGLDPVWLKQLVGKKTKSQQLNSRAVAVMNKWYEDHIRQPYPTEKDRAEMADQGGITKSQVRTSGAGRS